MVSTKPAGQLVNLLQSPLFI